MPIFDPADADLLVDRPQFALDDCPTCRGTGEGLTDYTVCTRCHGASVVRVAIVAEPEDESEVAHG